MSRTSFSSFHGTPTSDSENASSKLTFIENDDLQDLTSFSKNAQNEAKFRLSILRNILNKSSEINLVLIERLRTDLQQQEERSIPSAITIYRWWLDYKKSNFSILSLVPKTNQKGNRKTKVSKIVDIFMNQAVEQIISAHKINISTASRRVRRKVRQYNLTHKTQHTYPSYEALRKRVNKVTPYEKLAASKGDRIAKREFRRMGKKIQTEYLLQRVEIDHTWLDLFAVHEEHRVPIGRPYLTQLVDCHSKSVIGFYLGFEPPSYMSVALALKNAIKRKDNLLQNYPSIQNDWLCYGIPDLLVTDNGKEFLSKDFTLACDCLFINIHQNRVETPDNKPHTERHYGTTNTELLDDLPGKAFSNYLQREGYNSSNEASLTLSEIKEIYLTWLVDIFHPRPNSRGTNCPNRVWKNAEKKWPPNEFLGTDEELDFYFTKLDKRMLRKEGIGLATELFYSSERLAEYRGKKGNHKVTIKYNLENMGFIWVLDEDTESYFKVPAIDYEYASTVTLWMHKKNLKIKQELNITEHNLNSEIDAELRIDKIVDQSIQKKKTTITNKRRAARYQENKQMAENARQPKEKKSAHNQNTSAKNIEEDSSGWDIDYV